MLESEKEHIYSLGFYGGYSAKGICRIMRRVHKLRLTHAQVYGVLRQRGVKLWDIRHAKVPDSLERGVRLVAPKMKRRKTA